MIYSKPTSKGVGITIYGDYYDFKELHSTISSIINSADLDSETEDLLYNLSYELRHAFMGDRVKNIKPDPFHTDDNSYYLGVNLIWPLIIFQLSILKIEVRNTNNKRDKANFLILESVIEDALIAFDKDAGKQCIEVMNILGSYPDDYLMNFINFQSYEYVYDCKTKKQRVSALPVVLKSLSCISDEYKEFKALMQVKAAELNTNIHALNDSRQWDKFNW